MTATFAARFTAMFVGRISAA